jgi:hypothetical protein
MVEITQVLGSYQVSARVIDVGTETVVGRGEASSPLRTLEDLDIVANKIIAGMEVLPPPQALQPLVYTPPPTPAPVPAPAPEPAPAPQPQEPPPQLQAEQQPVVPVVPPVQEQAQEQPSLPRHAFTVDIVPAIIGVVFGSLGGIADGFLEDMKDEDGVSVSSDISGIGFGLQYEYQTSERTSLAVRIAYLGLGATVTQREEELEAKLKGDVTILSAEGHARTYPFGGAFFFDAVLGYSNLSLSFKGEDIVENDAGYKEIESISFKASQGYFKPGLKLGWRVSFGENGGGFVFEPSFNLCYAIRLGSNSLIKQIAKDTDNDYSEGAKDADDMLGLIESLALIGGPGFGLSFGYRF